MKLSSRFLKYGLLILIVLSIGVVLLGIGFITKSIKRNANISVTNPITENIEKVEKEEKTSISLVMVGDYLIHSSVYKDAAKNAGGTGYDFKPMLKYIKEKVKNYDLAYYNQETILRRS